MDTGDALFLLGALGLGVIAYNFHCAARRPCPMVVKGSDPMVVIVDEGEEEDSMFIKWPNAG